MGSLPSREKPLSIPPVVADTMQPPPPTQTAPSSFLAVALCDFPSGTGAAAVLRMGEQLRVLSEDGEWWLVASEASGKECHIPSSCVAKVRHRLLLAVGAPQRARLLGLGDTLPHPPPGERLALHLAPAHLPQPARPGGPLLRVGRGAVLPPRGALLHGRDEGGPSPHHARCGEEAITQVGQDRQLPPVLRGHVPAGGGLSHQPGPARNHQLLPPPDRDSRPGAGPCREGGKEQLRAGPSLSTAPRQTPGPHEGIGLGARRPGPGAWTWDS
ncbi:src-like-adapter 2 isoform X4 [Larus michahellis]|uniref:src-like-adapter 2 isoform X4 n=1 Tax=Larus michahellis TaxID=119627 RepID=UPI003D9B4006